MEKCPFCNRAFRKRFRRPEGLENLSDAEIKYISNLCESRRIESLSDEVLREVSSLRKKPQFFCLRLKDLQGAKLRFLEPRFVWEFGVGHGAAAIYSDGRFHLFRSANSTLNVSSVFIVTDRSSRCASVSERADTLLPTEGTQELLHSRGLRGIELVLKTLKDFGEETFLENLRIFLKRSSLYRREQTPREILTNELKHAIAEAIQTRLGEHRLADILFEFQDFMGMTLKELITSFDNSETIRTSGGPFLTSKHPIEFLTTALCTFVSQYDLTETVLWEHPCLEATLRHAYFVGRVLPEKKGKAICDAIALALGFEKESNNFVLRRKEHEINIDQTGLVRIDNQTVCIIPREISNVPTDDIIASKMLALAVRGSRERIETLADFRATLEEIFPEEETLEALKTLKIEREDENVY